MTNTYDGDPTGDRKDEVRMMVGDTDATDWLLTDEEIEYILLQWAPPADKPAWLAAAATCDAIAGKFGRKMQKSVGSLAASAQQQWEHYVALAQQFRVLYATDGLGIIEGDGFARVPRAVPILGGGGPTYLGSNGP